MTRKRVAPAERLPAPSNHRHTLEIEYRRGPHDLGGHTELARVDGRDPTADPQRDALAARVRLDMSLQVGRAAGLLHVRAVRALPVVCPHRVEGGGRVGRWGRGVAPRARDELGGGLREGVLGRRRWRVEVHCGTRGGIVRRVKGRRRDAGHGILGEREPER